MKSFGNTEIDITGRAESGLLRIMRNFGVNIHTNSQYRKTFSRYCKEYKYKETGIYTGYRTATHN